MEEMNKNPEMVNQVRLLGDEQKILEFEMLNRAAIKQLELKLEILNDEFQHVHRYNPIEHIKSRIKSSESIVKKLRRNGYE